MTMNTSTKTLRNHSRWILFFASAPAMLFVVACLGPSQAGASSPAPVRFTNYVQSLPGSSVKFEMVAIPGGKIRIGSPTNEAGREPSDLAPKEVTIRPFWMGKHEVSWQEYVPYVFIEPKEVARNVDRIEGIIDHDGVSHPTPPYGTVYRERGEKGYPALGMGLPAAREYCRWLSKKTGHRYRLPTEEEWEYACRAGSTQTFFWGNQTNQAKEYGWFIDNSGAGGTGETTHPLGKLKPNPFGLYDIVGNVAEWCAQNGTGDQAHRVLRGGAFSEPVSRLRCASRMIEVPEWNELDPQSPQSIWWLSSADFVGFRVVRSFDESADSEPKPHYQPPSTNKTAVVPQTQVAAGTASSPTETLSAEANYQKHCASCHGKTGKGDTALGKKKKARDYTDPKVKSTLRDTAMFKAIKEGLTVDDKHVMDPYADKLKDGEIQALVDLMKKF